MTADVWSLIAAVGTFVVITATAIAGFLQLRQFRRTNELAGLQSVFGTLIDPSVREIVNFVRHDLKIRMQDESFRAGLNEIPVDRRAHPEFYLCDIYNHIGSFVRSGLISEDVYLQTDWFNVILYWNLLRDSVLEVRRTRPYTFENFEWLVALAKRWADARPHGDYPADQPRMTD